MYVCVACNAICMIQNCHGDRSGFGWAERANSSKASQLLDQRPFKWVRAPQPGGLSQPRYSAGTQPAAFSSHPRDTPPIGFPH